MRPLSTLSVAAGFRSLRTSSLYVGWASSGAASSNTRASARLIGSLSAHLVQHVLGHVDRHAGRDGERDGVAGPGVDLDQLAVEADAELGVVGVLAQLADGHVAQLAAHALDDVGDQVVRQRP